MMIAKWFLTAKVVSRAEWEARPPKKGIADLKPEAVNFVVTYTETPQCSSKNECVRRVQDIQKKNMEEEDEPDIQYNFLIGGDGNVYEGRGWTKVPKPFPSDMNEVDTLQNQAIEIAFIGEFGCKPSAAVMKALAGLIVKGMEDKALTKDTAKLNPCLRIGNRVVLLRDIIKQKDLENINTKDLVEKSKYLKA